jgi:hypothetical protein
MSTCLVISLRKKTGKSGIASILSSPLKSDIRFPRTSSEVSKPESLYMCLIWKKVGCDNPSSSCYSEMPMSMDQAFAN